MLNKGVELKKRIKENRNKLPWVHVMDMYGFDKDKAKEFYKKHFRRK